MTVQSNQIIIDWLQFTLKTVCHLKTIVSILQLDVNNFIMLEKGMLGYKTQKYCSNISVCYDGQPGMGVHVVMSGKGCRYYETAHSILDLIKRINENEGKVTRMDLALDDTSGETIPFKRLVKDIAAANIISRWKDNTEIIKRSNKDAAIKGHTINIGSRTSKIFLRIYDKALEQHIDGIWFRMELEIKNEFAEELQKILTVENAGEVFSKLINNYMRVVIPSDTDSNKARWKTQPYWLKLLKITDSMKLTRLKEDKTIDDKKQWILEQCGPTMALCVMNDEGDLQFIYDSITSGVSRLKEKHLKLLERKGDKSKNDE